MKACVICSKKDVPENMVFSRWTRLHFCVDLKACAKRAARKALA